MVEPESQCFSLAMKSCTVAGTKENVVILTLMFFLINKFGPFLVNLQPYTRGMSQI
jgi:hypothetical protein